MNHLNIYSICGCKVEVNWIIRMQWTALLRRRQFALLQCSRVSLLLLRPAAVDCCHLRQLSGLSPFGILKRSQWGLMFREAPTSDSVTVVRLSSTNVGYPIRF